MSRLCPWCFRYLYETANLEELRELCRTIIDRKITLTTSYDDCSNKVSSGHPKSTKYVLDELPPSAKG